jgi:hypothetical protein
MSTSLNPWILEFLLNTAKEFGAKLFDVQPYAKKKKVQIIEVDDCFPTICLLWLITRESSSSHIRPKNSKTHSFGRVFRIRNT